MGEIPLAARRRHAVPVEAVAVPVALAEETDEEAGFSCVQQNTAMGVDGHSNGHMAFGHCAFLLLALFLKDDHARNQNSQDHL